MSFWDDVKKPFNIFTIIFSIALSTFFYLNGRKTKSISYQINEPSSLIYDSKNSSSAIKVLGKDSTPIKDNVYLLTGVLWNSGEIPIKQEDVRKVIILNLNSAKNILDFKIVKQVDPEVAGFKLIKINNESLELSWKYFDPGYACKFQIIYTGDMNSKFTPTGKILDIREIKKYQYADHRINWISIFLAVVVIFIAVPTVISERRSFLAKTGRSTLLSRSLAFMIALCCLMLVLEIMFQILFGQDAPIPL